MKLVEIYGGTLFECHIIQGILENEGINCSLKDEIIGSRGFGWRPGGGVKVVVSDENLEKARQLVADYDRQKKVIFSKSTFHYLYFSSVSSSSILR